MECSNKSAVIELNDVSVRFNLASEKVDNLKEYCIKLFNKQLLFQEFLALKNVSLTINRGESWGVVGRNGSGKSTLLKLICGILSPYIGTVSVRGSIAPLIELGAGFDGRLTATENIYLNGAILGHSKKVMDSHFKEIIDFAEIEKFKDVPLKNYSSGMRARLGFAVATIIKPDILIVDEVLAVGDKAFQRKCENKMQEMLIDNTTLLYVSHVGNSVRTMCKNAIWLENGNVMKQGDVHEVCDAYEGSMS